MLKLFASGLFFRRKPTITCVIGRNRRDKLNLTHYYSKIAQVGLHFLMSRLKQAFSLKIPNRPHTRLQDFYH